MEVHEIIVLFIPTLRVVQGGGGKRVDLIRAACSLTKSCLVKLPGGRSRLISFQHCRQYDGDNHHSHPTLEVISKKISYKARVIRPLHQLLGVNLHIGNTCQHIDKLLEVCILEMGQMI